MIAVQPVEDGTPVRYLGHQSCNTQPVQGLLNTAWLASRDMRLRTFPAAQWIGRACEHLEHGTFETGGQRVERVAEI